ncbi:MAG: prepilin-type N-terminal cleavage/methylation domain-containing protein [Candidatus Paceibacterota bacterium]|jgi:prepilin-type N-terminal cleavage/methylation domain-containing protein
MSKKSRITNIEKEVENCEERGVNNSRRSGFTLNEVLVVLAITVFLSGMLLSYNRSSEKQIKIFKDRSLIVGIFNRAKSLAEERFVGGGGANACAFGMNIDIPNKKISLFQDIKPGADVFTCKNLNGTYSPSLAASGAFYSDPTELLEEYVLDPRVVMTAKKGIPGVSINTTADILFVPPEMSATSTVSFPIVITLADAAGANSSMMTILSSGQITTQ